MRQRWRAGGEREGIPDATPARHRHRHQAPPRASCKWRLCVRSRTRTRPPRAPTAKARPRPGTPPGVGFRRRLSTSGSRKVLGRSGSGSVVSPGGLLETGWRARATLDPAEGRGSRPRTLRGARQARKLADPPLTAAGCSHAHSQKLFANFQTAPTGHEQKSSILQRKPFLRLKTNPSTDRGTRPRLFHNPSAALPPLQHCRLPPSQLYRVHFPATDKTDL